jgi:hypothetical protein
MKPLFISLLIWEWNVYYCWKTSRTTLYDESFLHASSLDDKFREVAPDIQIWVSKNEFCSAVKATETAISWHRTQISILNVIHRSLTNSDVYDSKGKVTRQLNKQCFCLHVALQFYILLFCLYTLHHLFTALFNSCRDSVQLSIVFLRIYIVIFKFLEVYNHVNFPQQALMCLYFH